MSNLRRWELRAGDPFIPSVAADARLSRTDYTDDQVWNVHLGTGDSAAIAYQTRYGGRVGLASLVPMWVHGNHIIYQAQTYYQPPTVTRLAPDLITLEAAILSEVSLSAFLWAMESQAVGGAFTLNNSSQKTVQLRLDLFAHVAVQQKELNLGLISMVRGGTALQMGNLPRLQAVVVLEDAQAPDADSPKIGTTIEIPPGSKKMIRFVHAGLPDVRDSLKLAQRWLRINWQPHLQQIDRAAASIPIIQTGNTRWDAVIDASYRRLVQSVLKPAGSFPHEVLVAQRTPGHGFSARSTGADHPRSWSGLDPKLVYQHAPVLASLEPAIGEGLVRNFIAMQQPDGWIDANPGPAGQRAQLLCLPILARTAWRVYEQTDNQAFIEAVFPALLRFFERWFQPDHDLDQDGLPEWQDERQCGYVAFPTFAPGLTWAQGAHIGTVETPDLAAYLFSEAQALLEMARLTGAESAVPGLKEHTQTLRQHLDALWQNGHYAYRDRDTHQFNTPGQVVLEDGPGDAEHFPAARLEHPGRLIVRVVGGVQHVPQITMHIDGLDISGEATRETIQAGDFRWQNRQGIYTTQQVFAQVDRIACEGLSRVYRIHAQTLDTTGCDINTLLPLWAGAADGDHARSLIDLAADPGQFWRPNGIAMTPASDPRFDPSNAKGGGGVWLYWATLVAEGLHAAGRGDLATDMLKQLLETQAEILQRAGGFPLFYHSDEPQGLGEDDHLAGITPLHLLLRLVGIRIVSSAQVWAGGPFPWGRAITVRQHGVSVRRTRKGIRVRFPSGHTTDLEPDAPWQAVTDPDPAPPPPLAQPKMPKHPASQGGASSDRVIIEVEHED